MMKRILSLLLVLLMVVSMLPTYAFAAGENDVAAEATEQITQVCETCGNDPCTCEGDGQEETENYDSHKGKYVKLNEAVSIYTVGSAAGSGFSYYPEDFTEDTILRIADWKVVGDVLWYLVEFYRGSIVESSFTADFPAEPWFQQTVDSSTNALVFLDTCETCGKPDCDGEHTEPTDPTDPTDPTNPTDPTDPTDPVEPEDPQVPSISATVNGQTVTVSGAALPEGATLSVSAGTQAQIDAFGGSSENHNLYVYNIELVKDGASVQPNGKVKVTISNVNLLEDGYVNIVHILDDADAIRKGIAENTAFPMDEPTLVNAFPAEAALAEEITGENGVLYLEEFSTADDTVTVSAENNSISFCLTSFSTITAANGNITASGSSASLGDGTDIDRYVLPGSTLTFSRSANRTTWRLDSTSNGVTGRVDSSSDFNLTTSNQNDNWTVSKHTANVTINVARTATGTTRLFSYRGLNNSNEAVVDIIVVRDAVSYNANGGSGAPGSQTKYHGENLTISSTIPTRTGYTFLGWHSSADNVVYQAGATYSANQATVMTALWGKPSNATSGWNHDFYVLPGTTTFSEQLKTIDGATKANPSTTVARPNIVADSNTYYVAPGTVMTFDRSGGRWRIDAAETGITTSAGTSWTTSDTLTVTVSSTAAVGTTMMLYSRSATGTTVNCARIIVTSRQEVTTMAIADDQNIYRVGLYILTDSTKIPGEPNYTTGVQMINVGGGMNYKSTANGIVLPDIANSAHYEPSKDGSCTMGAVDYSGHETVPYMDESLLNDAMDRVIQALKDGTEMTAADGTNLTALYAEKGEDFVRENYTVRPHVVKLMTGLSYIELGWHIDCSIYAQQTVTLTYDLNLPNGYSLKGLGTPAPGIYTGDVEAIPAEFTVTGNIQVGSGYTAAVSGSTDTASLTFAGWNTKPDGTGTSYAPSSTITTDKNVTLYAQWTGGNFTTGTLEIFKDVSVAANSLSPSASDAFTFSINLSGSYAYSVYNSVSGALVRSGTMTDGTFTLQDGQFIRFTQVPVNTYTVQETNLPANYSVNAASQSVALKGGYVNQLTFSNVYSNIPSYTVTYQYTGTVPADAPKEPDAKSYPKGTLVNVDTTTRTATGYTFNGWDKTGSFEISGNVTITGSWSPIKHTVTFYDEDGKTVLSSQKWDYGTTPTCTAPTKAATAEYTYTFAGWTPTVVAVTGDTTYKATYTATKNKYTVTFYDEDGTTVLGSQKWDYGATPTCTAPTKAPTSEYTYTFAGWTPAVVAVTGDATYKATYTATKNNFTITWQNDDGTVIDTTTVKYGEVPTHADPTKAADDQYTYTFAGWTPQIVAATKDATYKATYTSHTRSYTITWVDGNGKELKTESWAYNTMPQYTGATPTKTATDQFTYTWNNTWSPAITAVTGPATYTAQFDATVNKYPITWVDGDGKTLTTEQVEYGKTPAYTGATPTKTATAQYTYTFNNTWSPAISAVTGAATYTAQFDSQVNEYTVTWIDGDGKTLKTEQVEYGQTPVYSGETPTKTATPQYTYTWDNTWSPAVVTVTKDATYTAQFTASARTYTVTWWQDEDEDGVLDEGEILHADNDQNYNTKLKYDGVTPSKEATKQYWYNFEGWTGSDGKQINAYEEITVTGDAVYKAVLNPKLMDYTVTWKVDGVTKDEGSWEYGQTPTYKGETPTKAEDDGYTYQWTGEWTPVVAPVVDNVTYEAVFEKTVKTFSITYTLNGGQLPAGVTNPESYNVETDTFKLNNPERTGYEFTGWTESFGSEPQTEVIIYKGTTDNLTFTANWSAKDVAYQVVHWQQKIGGGSEHNDTNFQQKETENLTAKADSKVTPEVKSYEGFTAPAKVEVDIAADGSTVVNYYYTRNTYTINFHANEGDGTMESLTLAYNQSAKLPANAFTRKGYSFLGWATTATGAVAYADQADVENLTVEDRETIDLYAVWEINLFNLIIKTNNLVDANQSYIFTVSGRDYDGTEIWLQVAMGANDEQKIVGVPAGIYTVADQQGWSWRYEHQEIPECDVTTDQVADFNYTYSKMIDTKIYWLNGYGNQQIRKKEQNS